MERRSGVTRRGFLKGVGAAAATGATGLGAVALVAQAQAEEEASGVSRVLRRATTTTSQGLTERGRRA